ncbi:hypothetical protein NPIL_96591 [Nephila pilipes]|uniref:Uncharacterized protein n=1 Tax=Nephila pilipes TaxID=299642 RepID=A0A8X6TJJ0_NEPPI|nr:hypothetical protein NPIL_96591 [Nephila pilipes]
MKSITDDPTEWNDSLLLTLESSLDLEEEDAAFLSLFDFCFVRGGGDISTGRTKFVDLDVSGINISGFMEEQRLDELELVDKYGTELFVGLMASDLGAVTVKAIKSSLLKPFLMILCTSRFEAVYYVL